MTNGVAAMEIVDQQYDPTGNVSVAAGLSGMSFPPTQKRAQTFTVGQTGTLASVDVFVNAPISQDGTLRLEIRETTPEGLPVVDPTFLVQTTMPMSSISSSAEFHNFDLRQFQLPVSEGDELAIVLFVEEGGSHINWSGANGNPYQFGGTFGEQPPNHSWFFGNRWNDTDYGFRTTVAVSEPGILGDCDLNGEVNFLDIAPFITVLASDGFLQQADCNQDGVVSFLDIAPLVAILAVQ